MKKLKNFLLCFVLIICSLFFLGCSKVKLSTTLTSNGAISTSIEVKLENVSSNRTTIYQIFKEYYTQLDRAYEDNLLYYFSQVYDSEAFNSFDRKTKLEFILNNNIYYLVGNTEDYSRKDLDNYSYFYLKKDFASIYAYLMYFCPSAFSYDIEENRIHISNSYHSLVDVPMPGDGEIEESGNIFIKKYIQDFCPFYYNNNEPEFLYSSTFLDIEQGEKLKDVIINKCGFSKEEVEYYFSFTTPYKRLHSFGQTEITSSGYTHTWSLGSINSKIEVWRNYASYAPWYAFVIVVGVFGLVFAFLILKIIKNVKRKKGLKMLEKINNFQNSKK